MGAYAQSDVGSHPSAKKTVNYQYVFTTPFPKQYQIADSVFLNLQKQTLQLRPVLLMKCIPLQFKPAMS
jgi:hypothetical protein